MFVAVIIVCRLGAGSLAREGPDRRFHQSPAGRAAATGLHRFRASLTRKPDLRKVGLALASSIFGRLMFRLAVGRWPTRDRLLLFQSAMARDSVPVPPLLRGLSILPEAMEPIGWLLQLSHVYGGNDNRSLIAPSFYASATRLSIPPHTGNPLCVWTGPDIAFLHFEKAAGTSFLEEFSRLFHPGQIDNDAFRSMPPHLLSRFRRLRRCRGGPIPARLGTLRPAIGPAIGARPRRLYAVAGTTRPNFVVILVLA